MAIIIDFESIYQEYYGTKPNYQDEFEDSFEGLEVGNPEDDLDSYDDIIEDWDDDEDDVNFEEWDDLFEELENEGNF